MSASISMPRLAGLTALVLAAACSGAAGGGSVGVEVYEDPVARAPRPVEGRPRPPPAERPLPRVIAWTDGGDLALVDPSSFEVLATAPGLGLGGVRDVAHDPWASRAIVLESDDEDPWAEISALPLGPAGFGEREHLAWVDGTARVLATPEGVVVFEESYGQRWKLLGAGAAPAVSVIAAPPASVWTTGGAGGLSIEAFTYGGNPWEPVLDRRSAAILPGEIVGPSIDPLDLASAAVPATARVAPATIFGGVVLADVGSGAIAVTPVVGGAAMPSSAVLGDCGAAERIEHALSLADGEVVVLLTSSPARVLGAQLGPDMGLASAGALDLPGAVRVEDRYFSRDMVALSETKLLAATDQGLFRAAITWLGGGVELALEAGASGLRGPIAVVPPE